MLQNEKEISKTGTTIVSSIQHLKEVLLKPEPITELRFTIGAMIDINLVTLLIDKHHASLKTLIFDGLPNQTVALSQEEKINFANAVKKCNQLTLLHIENFKVAFREEIEHLSSCLPSLPNLIDLSFKGTFIYLHGHVLIQDLRTATSLKRLNLTHSCILNYYLWQSLGAALSTNDHLEELILGNSPYTESACENLCVGITAIGNNLKVLDWKPLPFMQNLRLYYEQRCVANWNADPIEERILSDLKHKIDGCDNNSSQPSEIAYRDLYKLQALLVQRRCTTSNKQMTVRLGETDPLTSLMCSEIEVHKKTLEEFSLQIDDIPIPFEEQIIHLLKVLEECSLLKTVKIENAQGHFADTFAVLFETIARLRNLRILSFNKTYLGERGIELLVSILKQNTLEELDLSHCGLINDNCFLILAKALECNTSLKKIKFGSSPMTRGWIRILGNAIARNEKNVPEITWQVTTTEKMNKSMMTLCHRANWPLYINPDLKYCYQKFVEQPSVDLHAHWLNFDELLKQKAMFLRGRTTYQQLITILKIVTEDTLPKKAEATEVTGLIRGANSTPIRKIYGASHAIETDDSRSLVP